MRPRVALVGPELEENLSLRYLASSLTAAGFDADIVPFDAPEQLRQVLARLLEGDSPLVIGLSLSFQPRAKDFLALAMALREHGYRGHLTAGGHFGTFASFEILRDFPEFDSIVRHEAEVTLVELATAVGEGGDLRRIAGLALRDGRFLLTEPPAPPVLESLPRPDRRGTPSQCLGHRVAPLVGSRGCYANCAFCCIAAWHEQTLPGKRFRLRRAGEVADEMAWLARVKHVEIFIFHDDNFFLPNRLQSLERIHALADALDARHLPCFSTVVKARPNDIDEEAIRTMQERLGLIRLFLGVESDADLGLRTLGRRVASAQNHQALDLLERTGVYACFNMLIFDPSTRLEDLEVNLRFMEQYAHVPQNFGRVELYAGTPLLARLQHEGRCSGDYLAWDYRMADEEVQRVFDITMRCFYGRNFSDESAPHRLMGTRFSVEVAAHHHPEVFDERWRDQAKRLNRLLVKDSVSAMREIIGFVTEHPASHTEAAFAQTLSSRLRKTERQIHAGAAALETEIQDALREPVGVNLEGFPMKGRHDR